MRAGDIERLEILMAKMELSGLEFCNTLDAEHAAGTLVLCGLIETLLRRYLLEVERNDSRRGAEAAEKGNKEVPDGG